MTEIDEEIQKLLEELEQLLKQIRPLREEVAGLQEELEVVGREYADRLGNLDRELIELEQEQANLETLLLDTPRPPRPTTTVAPPAPKAPPPVNTSVFEEDPAQVERPRRDPRGARKQALADHLFYLAADADDAIKAAVNEALVDPQQDVGHMLERLEWGPIWQESPSWEEPEEQRARLEEWRDILQKRLAFWRQRKDALENRDPRSGLRQEKRQRGGEGWAAFLAEQAAAQEAKLADLRQRVAQLRQRYQERRAQGGGA